MKAYMLTKHRALAEVRFLGRANQPVGLILALI